MRREFSCSVLKETWLNWGSDAKPYTFADRTEKTSDDAHRCVCYVVHVQNHCEESARPGSVSTQAIRRRKNSWKKGSDYCRLQICDNTECSYRQIGKHLAFSIIVEFASSWSSSSSYEVGVHITLTPPLSCGKHSTQRDRLILMPLQQQ